MSGHGVAEKFALPRSSDSTLLAIDSQSEALRQEALQRGQHAFARRARLHIHIAVVRIAGKAMPAALQFPIEVVEQDVAQER
jgi:hypothetical protein